MDMIAIGSRIKEAREQAHRVTCQHTKYFVNRALLTLYTLGSQACTERNRGAPRSESKQVDRRWRSLLNSTQGGS